MTRQPFRIGGYRYEHTEALFDGKVSIEGVDAVFDSSPLLSDVFYKMVKGEYDAAEFGLTYFLRTFDTEESPFLALPIFPNRNFRHSAIFINTGISGSRSCQNATMAGLPARNGSRCSAPTMVQRVVLSANAR